MITARATPTPIPALAPEERPLDALASSLPAKAVGKVVYEVVSVYVPTAEDASTIVVMVTNPVVPSLVTGTTDVVAVVIGLNETDVLVVTIVSDVSVGDSVDESDVSDAVKDRQLLILAAKATERCMQVTTSLKSGKLTATARFTCHTTRRA
jgi:hypothetical protein